jgi:hypothetical protein
MRREEQVITKDPDTNQERKKRVQEERQSKREEKMLPAQKSCRAQAKKTADSKESRG